MITIESIKALNNNDGLTIKAYNSIVYKTGWQVADYGYECHTAEEAYEVVKAMAGTCGIWLENGIYYVDHSFRVATKKQAMAIGREHNQISILKWANMSLAYC